MQQSTVLLKLMQNQTKQKAFPMVYYANAWSNEWAELTARLYAYIQIQSL